MSQPRIFFYFRLFFFVFFLSSVLIRITYAGNFVTIKRGTAPTINWAVASGATSCLGSTGYPQPSDIYSAWQGSTRNTTDSATLPVANSVGTDWQFTCTEPGGVSDSAYLTVLDCSAYGETWDGSSCVSGSISATDCTVAKDASTCASTVTWNSNVASACVYVPGQWACPGSGSHSQLTGSWYSPDSNKATVTLKNSSNNFEIATYTQITATCVAGTSWVGGYCRAPVTCNNPDGSTTDYPYGTSCPTWTKYCNGPSQTANASLWWQKWAQKNATPTSWVHVSPSEDSECVVNWSSVPACTSACSTAAYTSYATCNVSPGSGYAESDCLAKLSPKPSTYCAATADCLCTAPTTDSQTIQCSSRDAGWTGTINQTRSKSAYPTCAWGGWSDVSNTCSCAAPLTQNVTVACDAVAGNSVTGLVTRSIAKSAYSTCAFPSAPYTPANSTYVSDTCSYTCNNGANDPTTCSTYTITPSAGTGGSITPSGAQTVPRGGSSAFTITPDPGYSINSVSVDGSSVGAVGSYTFSNVIAGHTISATFNMNLCTAPTTDSQTIQCSSRDAGWTGTINQTRSKSAYPACAWGGWSDVSNTCSCAAPLTQDVTVACDANGAGNAAYSGLVTRNIAKSAYSTCAFPSAPYTPANSTYVSDNCVYPSANFTVSPSCNISAGASSCTGSISWTSSNLTFAVLTDCGGGLYTAQGPGAKTYSVTVPAGAGGCYQIHLDSSSGAVLATTGGTGICEGGTSWNGSTCEPDSGSITLTNISCPIAQGASTCNISASWSAFTASGNTSVSIDGNLWVNVGLNHTQTWAMTGPSTNTFRLYSAYNKGGTLLDTKLYTSSCTNGNTWNGSTCQPTVYNCSGTAPSGGNMRTTGASTMDGTWAYAGSGECTWSCDANYHQVSNTCVIDPPATPTSLYAGPSTCGNNWINLSWDAMPRATSYDVYKDGVFLLNTAATAVSDTGLVLGAGPYSYKVLAKNVGGSSAQSGAQSATVASQCNCSSQAKIWLTNCSGFTGATTNGLQSVVTFTGASYSGTATYSCDGSTNKPNGTYTYISGSCDAYSCGGVAPSGGNMSSNSVSTASGQTWTYSSPGTAACTWSCDASYHQVGTTCVIDPPATPTSLYAGPSTCGNNWINLSWDAMPRATSYDVYKDGVFLLNTAATAVSDTGLVLGAGPYSYKVLAKNVGGSSAQSGAQSATVAANCVCANPLTTDVTVDCDSHLPENIYASGNVTRTLIKNDYPTCTFPAFPYSPSPYSVYKSDNCTYTCANGASNPYPASPSCNIFTVTPSAGLHGTIAPNTPQSVVDNNTTSFIVTPADSTYIASVGGTCGGILSSQTGGTYWTSPIRNNCTVVATFTKGLCSPLTKDVDVACDVIADNSSTGKVVRRVTVGAFPTCIVPAATINDPIVSNTCAWTCDNGSAWPWPASPTCPAPSVDSATITGNNTVDAIMSYSCSNTTKYKITREINGDTIVPTTTYTGPVSIDKSVHGSIAGNYVIHCWSGTMTPATRAAPYYDPEPLATDSVMLNASPRTTKAGTMSTLTWSINNPLPGCVLKAYTVCSGVTCSPARTEDTDALTAELLNGNTDANDPYGSRSMKTALRTVATGPLGTKAIGKKTLRINYTTDFEINCHVPYVGKPNPTKMLRIQVTNDNEG